MQKVLQLSRTIKHFKAGQLKGKFSYEFKKFCFEKKILKKEIRYQKQSFPLAFYSLCSQSGSFSGKKFILLNRSKEFRDEINWNFRGFGLLWNIMLNSFECLNAEKVSVDEGINLIHSFIKDSKRNITLYDSYCISLRVINAIKFCSRFKVTDPVIDEFIYSQCVYLKKNPEFHLRNNHLLENGFALLFASLYFNEYPFFEFSERLLINNFPQQILADGAHFELSPMYHLQMLHRMLDAYQLIERSDFPIERIRGKLKYYIPRMLGWIQQMQMTNGIIPSFNDSNEGFGPCLRAILRMATDLKIDSHIVTLKDSGFRKLKNRNFEMIVDVNGLSPNEAPGHSHADTFHFVLNVFGDPFILETGSSTYAKGKERAYERSTHAHNTVVIKNMNQSELYDSFRVGRRAKVIHLKENFNEIESTHDGYSHEGILHTRKIVLKSDGLEIIDRVSANKPVTCTSYLHIDKKSGLIKKNDKFLSRFTNIEFLNHSSSSLEEGWHAPSFGVRSPCYVIKTSFQNEIITRIRLNK